MVSARSLNKRSTTIIIAAVLALGTGLLAFNYLSTLNKVSQTVPMRSVVVATQDIAVRTVITPPMLTTMQRPADSVDPDTVSAPSAAIGQIALIAIPAGGSISASKIGRIGLGGLPVRIPAGQRAVSISLDRVKGVADLIEAGDHVDVIAVSQARGTNVPPTVATILTNKTVLAMGTQQEAPAALGSQATPGPQDQYETATLAVTPGEARILSIADINATLRLALRSVKDLHTLEQPQPFVIATSPPVASAQLAPASAAQKDAGPKATPHPTFLIDGDHFVEGGK